MSKLPDFEGLAMFAKVAEERSYAGAARSMGVSVATVSRAVSRLEDRLGGRLFNRSSRRLALTDFGREFADRAARIYAEAEEIECVALETARRPRGVVRLAVPMSFGTCWVAPILPDFFRQYPDIAVDLHLSDEKVDLIGDGFDAALQPTAAPRSSRAAITGCHPAGAVRTASRSSTGGRVAMVAPEAKLKASRRSLRTRSDGPRNSVKLSGSKRPAIRCRAVA
jgi:DNA-binding transcriptional LysR family regulator